jgi:uncharacterized membrane protein
VATLAAEAPAAGGAVTSMTNRMAITALALVGVLISIYMSAYTFGLLGEIVCGSGGCETVQHSPWARFVGVPVPLIGLLGYGALFVTGLVGLQPVGQTSRVVAGMLAAGATIGVLFSAYLTYLEAFVIHAWCRWCVVSAALAVAIFLFTLPEFGRARRPS